MKSLKIKGNQANNRQKRLSQDRVKDIICPWVRPSPQFTQSSYK